MGRLIALFIIACLGFWSGKSTPIQRREIALSNIDPKREFPLQEHKAFVVILYAHNQVSWCQRALRSVFEQNYDQYRLIFIDDASADQTAKAAKEFILNNNQDGKVLFLSNESPIGPVASLYRAIDHCLDREIVIFLDAKDWFASHGVLKRLDLAYQNPDVWLATGFSIEYPAYKMREEGPFSYYAALFKQLRLHHLFQKGEFAKSHEAYLPSLIDLAGGRIHKLQEPISFLNLAPPKRPQAPETASRLSPLNRFPESPGPQKADIIFFSSNQPLQLYASLESIQRYVTGYERLYVLYRASEAFAEGYREVKKSFPKVHFVRQEEHSFKALLEEMIQASLSNFLLVGTDGLIVKDFVDLPLCMDQMIKTGAYAFYLNLGCHIQSPPSSHFLGAGTYAWDLKRGDADWKRISSFDLTLYPKEKIAEVLSRVKPKNAAKFEEFWAKKGTFPPVGLYFASSKVVSVSHLFKEEELLAKFNQGFKIDIEPLYKMENRSPVLECVPEFTLR